MKILVFSPLEMPYTTGARYTGLERLAVQFAEEWAKLGHEVAILAHKDTAISPNVKLLPCDGYEVIKRPDHAETHAYQQYQAQLYDYDVIWDISHLHIPARYMPQLKTVNVFHANPEYAAKAGYVKASYNLVSWSKWGVREIEKWYHHKAVYQETIMVDSEVYKPKGTRSDRYLTLGRMSPEKGNLNAVKLCKQLESKLDVCGGRGSEITAGQDLTEYEKTVKDLCDGTQIVFYGEVSDEQKIELMQSCRGLLYMTEHVEITSHKVQEAMLCGAPVIAPEIGGMPEIVTHGIDGFLCRNMNDYVEGINNLDKLNPEKTRDKLVSKYNPQTVALGYIELFEKVKSGVRW